IRDLSCGSQDIDFGWDFPHAHAVVYLGMVVKDPFLLSCQSVPGNKTGLYSIAALQVENYLWEFAGILELQGYRVKKMVGIPDLISSSPRPWPTAAGGWLGKTAAI
ncbi:MAG: hypothetical protein PHI41_07435, partial [Erysipelotrichaceae bacterium]|nr:hypothetical protein [Erysipelotrichaceae bacterium]